MSAFFCITMGGIKGRIIRKVGCGHLIALFLTYHYYSYLYLTLVSIHIGGVYSLHVKALSLLKVPPCKLNSTVIPEVTPVHS